MPTMIILYDAGVLEWFINTVKNFMQKGLVCCCWTNCDSNWMLEHRLHSNKSKQSKIYWKHWKGL